MTRSCEEIEAEIHKLVREMNDAIKDGDLSLVQAKNLYTSLSEDIGWLQGCRNLLRVEDM